MEDQHLPPQRTKPDVPVVRMPDFWPHAATYWFFVLEAQFKVLRINMQDVRYAILTQWMTKEISVSDVLLGHTYIHTSKEPREAAKQYQPDMYGPPF